MTTFAVYNDMAIFGVGNTEDAAWADLAQWVDMEELSRDAFDCAPMTKALARQVQDRGGNIPFGEYRGTLMTRAAYERVY